MKNFAASKLNLWLGGLLIIGSGLMLLFYPSANPAALFVIGVCNLVIGLSARKAS